MTILTQNEGAPPSKPDWSRRWMVVRLVLGFCALVISYAVGFGPDDRLRETAMVAAFGLSGAVALGYLGFAVQDDLNWMRELVGRGEERRR